MAAQPETSSPHLPCGSEIKSRPMGAERSGIYIFQFIPNLSTICLPWTCSQFSSVQLLSYVRLFATPWITAHQASLSIINSRSSLKLTSIESVMPSSHLILCRPLLLLPPIPPSIRVFSNESTLHMRWSKYWSPSFSIIPSKEHPGLISFRMDWLDPLAVYGTLKSLLQYTIFYIFLNFVLLQDFDYSSLCYTVGPCCLFYI